jgi:hypothetical protein
MKRYLYLLFLILIIGIFNISGCSICEEDTKLTDSFEANKINTSHEVDEYFMKAMEAEKKNDWKRIIRSKPEVFNMTIDGKSRECYYEGKNIICE